MQLVKFESKSNRVKGLSFHPKRPWVLASLHNGVIQLLDYRMCTLLERFEDHEGPVRGVCFHASQPMFVSGGDDYKIKVWDYKLRRCLFTLVGHLDYIRTVEFHKEHPWIVSASDDQTIRIWNWQARACVSVLTGHNHYVMCARFHPEEDLVVSASLDQTVRVWDTSGLRRKSARGAPKETRADSIAARMNADFFGGNDAVVKYVLEGHERGVNWASFHPKMALIVSAADDRLVKIWRMSDTKAWEMDTLRGHGNNVSCCMFIPKADMVISNSEDRTIRIWDVSRQMGVQTFRREHDRFWILAAHPAGSLLAAGHDSGMMVFKLARERPAYVATQGQLFYVKRSYLRRCVIGSGADVPIQGLRASSRAALGQGPRTLVHNPFNKDEDNLLLHSTADGGYYLLFNLNHTDRDPTKGRGVAAAVFLQRNRFITLDTKYHELVVRSLSNEIKKRLRCPINGCNMIFPSRTAARVLLRNDDMVVLFEPQSRRILGEVFVPRVKYVQWSNDGKFVALMSKNAVCICTKDLDMVCTVSESLRVKSGVWDSDGVFVFTTHTHIKYVLPIKAGDVGIVRTLPEVVYAIEANGDDLHCLNRDGETVVLKLDRTEYQFKMALAQQKWDVVMRTVRSGRLCGQAVIGYLQRMGFPEVALYFVEDEATRFNLALEYGNLDVAMKSAKALNTNEMWSKLAQAALRQGNHEIVEMAYQQNEDYERLSFLYLITGNIEKLRLMLKIAGIRQNGMAKFHNSLFLGDVATRIQVLEQAGQIALAYQAAATHGLAEEAERFRAQLEAAEKPVPEVLEGAAYLQPPTPLMRTDTAEEDGTGANWPLLKVQASVFDQTSAASDNQTTTDALADEPGVDPDDIDDAWDTGLDLDLDGGLAGAGDAGAGAAGDDEAGGWDDTELDLPTLTPAVAATRSTAMTGGKLWRAPSGGTSTREYWVHNSSVPGDHAAAGSFETAMTLLNRQIGVTNYAPLRAAFMKVFTGAQLSLPTLPSVGSLSISLPRNGGTEAPGKASLPRVSITLRHLLESLKAVFKSFQSGKFATTRDLLDVLLHELPLVAVDTRSDESKVKEVLGLAMEYRVAVQLELQRRSLGKSPDNLVRQLELASYITHCNIKPPHLMLTINLAMVVAFKAKNFITAAGFARRMLELPETMSAKNEKMAARARSVLQAAEAQGRNALSIDYDEKNPFNIDCRDLKPIYRGSPTIRCPYCSATYTPVCKGTLCDICGISEVGVECVGLVVSTAARR